jgi:SAM-dependent methyltransferase
VAPGGDARVDERLDEMVSSRYKGESGRAYAEWQLAAAGSMGRECARAFSPYVETEDTVVDLGCGGGAVLSALRCRRRIGVEPNPVAGAEARKAALEVVPTLNEVPDSSADVVISNHCLEHCLRPLDEIREARRVLKPGGRLVVVVPIDDWRGQRRYTPADVDHHLYTWTPQLIGNLLQEAGFEVGLVRSVTRAWPRHARWLHGSVPRWTWEAICFAMAVVSRRRQICAVALVAPGQQYHSPLSR